MKAKRDGRDRNFKSGNHELMKKKTRGRNINTASETVTTSACKEIKVATSVSGRDTMSKREKIATTFSCRDISSTDEEVATSLSCRDTCCKGFKVATLVSCRDINCEDLRSRHHSEVATAAASKRGRDISLLSRHQLQRVKGRDNSQRSRHPLHKKEGRDIIQLSRYQIQRVKVATSRSGRDTRHK